MTYVKQTWSDGSGGGTPITAARLAYMEDGIEAADLPTPIKWATELRVSDAGTRAIGYMGATLGVAMADAMTLQRIRVRFATGDASGSTTIQIRKNGVTTGMPLLTVTAPGLVQVWTGSIALAQNDTLTAEIATVGGTPGTGLMVLYSGIYT